MTRRVSNAHKAATQFCSGIDGTAGDQPGKVVMLNATLTFVRRKEALVTATSWAKLDQDDVDFLSRHVDRLRDAAGTEDQLITRFQQGSGIPTLLGKLLTASEDEFVAISAELATRLQESMDQSTTPSPGVLAIIVAGPDGATPKWASVLKLDAISEAASFEFDQGEVTLSVLRDLLPAPGQLQKGISWPDPRRSTSDAIVIDRNQSVGRYFFDAYELQVSPTPAVSERALAEAIVQGVERDKRVEAMQFAATLGGRADEVAAQVKRRYPSVRVDSKELGAQGALGGYIRPRKVAAHLTRFRGDGIVVTVPHERLGRVSGPQQAAGGWQMTITFTAKPEEEIS
jgi:hypothetical protein